MVGVLTKKVGSLPGGLLEVFGRAGSITDLKKKGDVPCRIDVPVGQGWAYTGDCILSGLSLRGRGMAGVEDTFPGQQGTGPVALEFEFGGEAYKVSCSLGCMFGIFGESG